MNAKRVRIDPENHEPAALFKLSGSLTGKRVLEIGCGDGRLTWRYAHLPQEIVGLDPDETQIAIARQNKPSAAPVDFQVADILDFHDTRPFDIAILSWSL